MTDIDDWYDDDYEDGGEPDEPECGLCYERRWVPARVFGSFRRRRCPSCHPNPFKRLMADVRWWLGRRRRDAAFFDEAPF